MRTNSPLLLLVVSTTQAWAQDQTRAVRGAVADSANNKPVPGVSIYVDGTVRDERTGKDGAFRIDAGTGQALVVLRRPGYVPVFVDVPAAPVGDVMDLGVTHIRQVKTDADQAAVRSADLRMYPHLVRFYDRKGKFRGGAFLTPDELEQTGGSLTDLIRRQQGFREMCVGTRQSDRDCGKKSDRGPSTIYGTGRPVLEGQQLCLTRVWSDDIGPERTLDEIPINEILAVEAYPNAASTPKEFSGSSCATIMLWMKKRRP